MIENITWTCKTFDELSNKELYAILKARNKVFVVEQLCNYQDMDDKDAHSHHLVAWHHEKVAAYCRIIPPHVTFEESSIGRVLTTSNYRKQGIGIALMQKAITKLETIYGKQPIKIGAQLYLKKFYESFGFKQVSPTYLEDNIPHIEMILT